MSLEKVNLEIDKINLEAAKGKYIAELLNLIPIKKESRLGWNKENIQYYTVNGDKTALGLFLMLQRFFQNDISPEEMKIITKFAKTNF